MFLSSVASDGTSNCLLRHLLCFLWHSLWIYYFVDLPRLLLLVSVLAFAAFAFTIARKPLVSVLTYLLPSK